MGWASGAEIAEDVWSVVEGFLEGLESPEEAKGQVALGLVKIFESHDCDTMEEASFVSEYLEWDEDTGEWRTIYDGWRAKIKKGN